MQMPCVLNERAKVITNLPSLPCTLLPFPSMSSLYFDLISPLIVFFFLIWIDVWSAGLEPNKASGNVAVDQYHRYKVSH